MRGCTPTTHLNSGSYWTKVHQTYTQCSQIITDELFKNQNGNIAIRFGIVRLCQF